MTGPLPDLASDVLIDLLAVLREALTIVARHARPGVVHRQSGRRAGMVRFALLGMR